MNWAGEPKLADALGDPVVQALMKADGVDVRELGVTLSGMALKMRSYKLRTCVDSKVRRQ